MRLALIHFSGRRVGGAESYLESLAEELEARGNSLSLFHEIDEPNNRSQLRLPVGDFRWCATKLGNREAIQRLNEWKPDFLLSFGLLTPELETRVLEIAPTVLSVHGFFGTCISGRKTRSFPSVRPCPRRFGPTCLLHYHLRQCGGRNPLTMWSDFSRQRARARLFAKYTALVTLSQFMARELIRNGVAPDRVWSIPWAAGSKPAEPADCTRVNGSAWRLLFVGRFDELKGGGVLLNGLPEIRRRLDLPVELTFVGDGPLRTRWEKMAREVMVKDPGVRITFSGWVEGERMHTIFNEHHLLVMPSLWPEPTGLIGAEAASFGVPTVAFRVGGIPEWLTDGVNGCLSSGDSPIAKHLVDAVCKCLSDGEYYARLRKGALAWARQQERRRHVDQLLKVFRTPSAAALELSAPGLLSSGGVAVE